MSNKVSKETLFTECLPRTECHPGTKAGAFWCDLCETQEPMAAVCKECGECLCEFHSQAHRKTKMTASHLLGPEKEPKVCRSKTYCDNYPREELRLFCATCDLV